ncbi:MAG: hypothetical protein H0X33_08835 [Taibaiella sp.]|nr:hypothetical protein [Taibaiella sp.]
MKKVIFTPLFVILCITLWSFAPAPPTASKVIYLADGTAIIPSTANISSADRTAILDILTSHGTNAGYLVYQNASNLKTIYNAASATGLSKLDVDYGSDLSNANSFSGYVSFVGTIGADEVVSATIQNSTVSSDIAASLAPILAKYE